MELPLFQRNTGYSDGTVPPPSTLALTIEKEEKEARRGHLLSPLYLAIC